MSLRLSSLVVTLCLGAGFLSLPLPVQSLPVNAIAQVNSASTAEDFFNQGVKRLQQGDFEAAISDFNEAISLDPNYAQAYGNRGIAYSRLKQYDKAVADYNQFIRFNPNSAEAYYNRGTLYDKLGDYQKAIADYDRAIRLNPNFNQAISNREIAQNKLRTPQSTQSNFTPVPKPNAIAQSSSNPSTADDFFNRGKEKYNKGDFQGAIVDFSQAIQLKPDYTLAYLGRSIAYKGLAELENSITDLRKAVQLSQKQGNTETSQIALEALQATQNLNNIITQSDSHSKLKFAAFVLNEGAKKEKKGDLREAIADYNLAIRINPELALAYAVRGIAYGKLGEHQKVIADLQKAANLYQQQGNTAEAQKTLEVLKIIQQ